MSRDLKGNAAAQQAGILASMARAHEKMLREIYFQKLQRKQNAKAIEENKKLLKRVSELESMIDNKSNSSSNSHSATKIASLEDKIKSLELENSKLKAAADVQPSEGNTNDLEEENKKLRKKIEELQSNEELKAVISRNKMLEVENMRMERKIHEMEGIERHHQPMPIPPPRGFGVTSEERIAGLEHRVADLEHLEQVSPRVRSGSPASIHERHSLSPRMGVGPTQGGLFTVRVACDVHGKKYNARFSFPSIPTMGALINTVNSFYGAVARVSHPPGCPPIPFSLAALQVFDAMQQRWVDLTDPFMISSDAQLFCFQQASVWHPDRPGTIPTAEDVLTWTSLPGSPTRSVPISDPPSLSVMIVSVFRDLDVTGTGHVRFQDLRDGLSRYSMEVVTLSSIDLFKKIDRKNDGVITYDEWMAFARDKPRFIEAMYCMALDSKGDSHQFDVSSPVLRKHY
eukprot:TRINITY_DN3363_c5_g1_i1.p1 TRINITY_DN3363_c5_g1~~TRINITY_DN3363_c5_g1_i1.p1  ORF type:complete len:478 (+),score=95.73 TRINITY_DN3363_c5_g1_i1:65-1435(+)